MKFSLSFFQLSLSITTLPTKQRSLKINFDHTYIGKLLFKFTVPKWYPITKYYSTLSAIDLSKIHLIKISINNFASNLTNNLDTSRYEIKNIRSETREYGKLYRKF